MKGEKPVPIKPDSVKGYREVPSSARSKDEGREDFPNIVRGNTKEAKITLPLPEG